MTELRARRVNLKACTPHEAIEESTALIDALAADSLDRYETLMRKHGADEHEIEIELARYADKLEAERAHILAKLNSWL